MGCHTLWGFHKAFGGTAGRGSITLGAAVLAAIWLGAGIGAALSTPIDGNGKVDVGRDDPAHATGIRTTVEPPNGSRVHPMLSRLLAERAEDEPIKAWVLFADKGIGGARALATATAALASTYNPRAVERRRNRRTLPGLFDEHDLPVARQYIDAVRAAGARVVVTSKWLNGVSVWATGQQVEQIDQLPFVEIIQPVRRGRKIEPVTVRPVTRSRAPGAEGLLAAARRLDYGHSAAQLGQINLINVHDQGFTGAGVIIGVLDTGFRTSHVAFHQPGRPLQVVEEWDFINDDGNTDYEDGDPLSQHHHGTYVLGTLGAYMPGELIGGAFDASFILCKTEDTSQEVPIEEDYFVAGLEFIEAEGGDVATSSLGYIAWYDQRDLDGMTAVTTIAVNIATANGVHCCTAAGNDGHDADPTASSLIAPSDAFQVLTCGAVNVDGDIAYFSSDGPTADGRVKPELLARGVNTYTINIGGTSYETVSGTSLSTPLVAGAVACLVQAHPTWSVDQMRAYLLLTAGDYVANGAPDPLYVRGYGIVDAFAALAGDCNYNGLSDETDIADGTSVDCNANSLPDDCELALFMSPDCNDNGTPDECEVGVRFTSASPELSPIGYGISQSHTVLSPPATVTDVTLAFTAYADLNADQEKIDVSLNGTTVGSVFTFGASDCPPLPDADELVLSAAEFSDIVNGGDAVITMEAAPGVNPSACDSGSFITVTVRYHTAGASLDCNTNGVPDECEPGDFNGDGLLRLSDLSEYAGCYTGPCRDAACDPPLYVDPCCALADFDADGDNDLTDWAAFQVAFSTP